MADDGPSDEETGFGGGGAVASHHPKEISPVGLDFLHDDDGGAEEDDGGGGEAPMLPPPPPPPGPPPTSRQLSPRRQQSSPRPRRRRGGGKNKLPIPQYPTTIEVVGPRSRMASRAKQKVHATAANHSYDNELPASGRAEAPMMGNYESFPDPSVNNSLLESSMDESQQQQRPNKSMDDSIDRSPIPNSRKTARGQVLVHYHPQLGDEGYESTLLERPAPETRSRASRAIATATRGDSGGDGAAGGSDNNNGGGPPRNIYPGRGMHARAIDHVREEEIYSGRRGAGNNVAATDGNDEYNNAATRQIRRRVLRVALERGIHDERRRKLRDADMDIGGPSLRVDTDDANAGGDAKGGFNDVISPLSSASPRKQPTRNGFGNLKRSASKDSANEGDMPLSPRDTATPKTLQSANAAQYGSAVRTENAVIKSPLSRPPPSPPKHRPPSYATIVRNLIAANEPEKLQQIDRVMEKYAGREEELIKKLDLRYRRRKAKKEQILDDLKGAERTRSKDGDGGVDIEQVKSADRFVEQVDTNETDGTGIGSKPGEIVVEKTSDKPLSAREMEGMTSPAKITFLNLNAAAATQSKKKSAIMAMQSWDRSEGKDDDKDEDDGDEDKDDAGMPDEDGYSPPPKIRKKPFPMAISDSTLTDIHANAGNGLEDDDNSGFIGIPNISSNISKLEEVENLGNQVMKERMARGKRRTEEIVRVTSFNSKAKQAELDKSMDTMESEQSETRHHDDYKLKSTSSYGDGISVITMETKATMKSKSVAGLQRIGGDGEAVYGFEVKPPNSITVEDNSGSFENNKGETAEGKKEDKSPRFKKVVPEMETKEEKAKAAEESLETKSKLDNVEARIQARHQTREEEEAKKQSMSPGLMQADDELDDVESLFQSRRSPQVEEGRKTIQTNNTQSTLMDADDEDGGDEFMQQEADMNTVEVDDNKNDEDVASASPEIIEDILSSFDEADEGSFMGAQTKKQQHQQEEVIEEEAQQSSSALDNNHEDEARIVKSQDTDAPIIKAQTSKDDGDNHTISTMGSRHYAEKAIAAATRSELQRQRQVMDYHRHRDQHLQQQHPQTQPLPHALSWAASASSAGSANELNEKLEEEIARLMAEKESRFEAEKALALMKARRELEVERRARLEAEAAMLRVEEELERLKMGAKREAVLVGDAPSKDQVEANEEQISQSVGDGDEEEPKTSSLLGMLKWRKSANEKALQEKLNKLSPEKMPRKEAEETEEKSNALSSQLASDEEEVPPSETNTARMDAEFARLKAEQELERLKLEKLADEAEAARLRAEEELERLKSDRAGKESEASRVEAEEELEKLRTEKATAIEQDNKSLGESDWAEAEAARREAEEQLEKLKLARAAAARADVEESEEEPEHDEFHRMNSEREDTVEKFRQYYSSEEEEDENNQQLQLESTMDMEAMSDVENDDEVVDLQEVQTASFETAREVVDGEEEDKDFPDSATPVIYESDSSGTPEYQPSYSEREDEKATADQEERVFSQGATAITPRVDRDEHDFPSTTMAHAPKLPQDFISDAQNTQVKKTDQEEDEAQIHHVARRAFEGDRSKGQISFATGSKIEAHSNQRGPWWLGRCGGRTGWFPASAVVPASQFLASGFGGSPMLDVAVDAADEDEDDVTRLSGDELNAVYDLIRNPSDPAKLEEEDDESEDDGGSPAKSRWLANATTAAPTRDHSPPPSRLDPSEMAGLSERLYDSHDDDSRSNQQDVGRRSLSSSLSNGASASAAATTVEPLSKNEPAKKADATISSQSVESSRQGESEDSRLKASTAAKNQAVKPGWRAAKDPNSGLIYYFHSETRETTWKKPPGLISRQSSNVSAKTTTPRSVGSKDTPKGGRGKGFMGFLSKITKGRDAETASSRSCDNSLVSPKEAVKGAVKKETVDSPKEAKSQAHTSIKRAEKVPEKASESNLTAKTEIPQNDFWTTLDDESSSVSDDESTHSEGTETSMFSKQMLKSTVGKLAGTVGKFAGKISEPKRTYETLDDSMDQGTPGSSAHNVPAREKSSISASSNNDELHLEKKEGRTDGKDFSIKEESTPQSKSGDALEAERDATRSTAEMKSRTQIGSPNSSDHESTSKVVAADNKISANDGERNDQSPLSEKDAGASRKHVEAAKKKEVPAKGEVSHTKTHWRSAIDAATGRTYYYVKGTSKVTWEKPLDL